MSKSDEETNPATVESVLNTCIGQRESPFSVNIDRSDSKPTIKAHLWTSHLDSLPDQVHLVIFTHGAGGTCLSPAASRLCQGLVGDGSIAETPALVVLGFDGSSNLKARATAFAQVIQWASRSAIVQRITLAGRSMGCRAAAIAAAEVNSLKIDTLILQSYPLIGNGEAARKQVLMDLPSSLRVLFVHGSEDDMCPTEQFVTLQAEDLPFTSSTIIVDGADHGMSLTRAVKGMTKAEAADVMGMQAAHMARNWLSQLEVHVKLPQTSIIFCDEGQVQVRSDWDTSQPLATMDLPEEPDKVETHATVQIRRGSKRQAEVDPVDGPRRSKRGK